MYLSSLSALLHTLLLPLSVAALAVDTKIQGRTQTTPDGNKIGSQLPQNLRIEQKLAHHHSPARPSKHFPRWPELLIEAHGDYRDEEFLEQRIGGPLYSKQKELPRLPVPSLEETINRLLPTAMPLALEKEEKQKFIDACQVFPKEAKDLQYRLSERREEYDRSSWLQQLWNTNGYLRVRDPVAVKVSYFLFVPDDNTLPHACQKGIARAAAMIVAMAQSRKLVCSGQMPYETIQHRGEDEILCSTGFKYIFHGCRIPRREQDAYHIYDPSQHKHCVVACGGQFFSLQFVDEMDDPLSLEIIEEQLKNCVKLAKSTNSSLPELGWLTSAGRDFWADAREELLQVGGTQMKEALSTLESGAFVLNLDDEAPESMTEAARIFWYGGASSGGNRWFDKSCQLVCTKNGRVAYIGEHAMLDAAPVVSLISRILKTPYKRLLRKQEDTKMEESLGTPDGVFNIFANSWQSQSTLSVAKKLVTAAKAHHKNLSNEYEIEVEEFRHFGKKFIKKNQFSMPCYTFVQMAIQLAAFRLFGQQVACYEAALTRNFLHGRTETVRPVSYESQAFLATMGKTAFNDDMPRKEKLSSLGSAAEAHAAYQNKASKGLGVDRHLFGLESMLRDGDEKPELFSNPLYLRSKRFRLSTSSVTYAPGFCSTEDNGIGIGFRVEPDALIFTCTSRKDNNYIAPFRKLLTEALQEIGDLVSPEKEKGEEEAGLCEERTSNSS